METDRQTDRERQRDRQKETETEWEKIDRENIQHNNLSVIITLMSFLSLLWLWYHLHSAGHLVVAHYQTCCIMILTNWSCDWGSMHGWLKVTVVTKLGHVETGLHPWHSNHIRTSNSWLPSSNGAKTQTVKYFEHKNTAKAKYGKTETGPLIPWISFLLILHWLYLNIWKEKTCFLGHSTCSSQ